MRGTIHIVSAADFWLLAAGIRRAQRQWWERVHKVETSRVDSAVAAVAEELGAVTAGALAS